MRHGWAALAVLCVVLAGPAHGQPAAAPAPSEQRFAKGAESWGVSVAHGLGLGVFGSNGRDVEEVEYVGLVPRYGRGLTDPVGEGRWYHGNLELLLEGTLLVAYAPKGGFIGGANALLRYNFLGDSRFVPFLEVGAGVAGLELDLEDQADGLAFALQGGLGLHYWLSRQLALTAEWRLHHLSNADIHHDNTGINDSRLMVGLSWFP
jgi:hypothetical protein